jgi:hypothetical protein
MFKLNPSGALRWRATRLGLLAAAAMLTSLPSQAVAGPFPFKTALVVSRIEYDGNTFGNPASYPDIFNDPTVSGVQGSIHLDQYLNTPGSSPLTTLALPTGPFDEITTSFSSKSEGALMLSPNASFLGYIAYQGPVGSEGVSNSYTTGPGTNLIPPVTPAYNREVGLIATDGTVNLQPEINADSGDNPRAAITVDGNTFYTAGNSDSTIYNDPPKSCPGGAGTTCGPGLTIGVRYGMLGSDTTYQLGVYVATDRPDETPKQHIKDNNWRGIGIYNGNLYVSKGSGGNGDDGVFQVHNGTGDGLPTGTGNTITPLFSAPATDPATGAPSPYTPFGFWFANPTTLYVADEGYANFDTSGNFIPDPFAGLEKWSLVGGTWQLDYTLIDGLGLYQPDTSATGYPVPTYTTGLRNMTGIVNPNGTVTIYAITSQYSTISGGEPDPDRLVGITDSLSATTLPASESFVTLQSSGFGEVFRGVALAPCGFEGVTIHGALQNSAHGYCK